MINIIKNNWFIINIQKSVQIMNEYILENSTYIINICINDIFKYAE